MDVVVGLDRDEGRWTIRWDRVRKGFIPLLSRGTINHEVEGRDADGEEEGKRKERKRERERMRPMLHHGRVIKFLSPRGNMMEKKKKRKEKN